MNGTFNLGGSQFELTDERQDRVADIASQIAIHKQSGHRVWIKSIPKYSTRNLKKNAWMKGDDGGLNQQITEIHLILAISKLLPRHPNVGNLIGITETDNFYYCVTELPSSSSVTLASFLQSTRSISEKEIFVIFHQVFFNFFFLLFQPLSFFSTSFFFNSTSIQDSCCCFNLSSSYDLALRTFSRKCIRR